MDFEDEILRLKALNAIHSADVSALLMLSSQLHELLSRTISDIPPVGETFLRLRKQFLHAQLEHLEKSNPTLAAQLQQTIDDVCTIYPFDYDET